MKYPSKVAKSAIIAGASLALGLLFNYLLFEQMPGLSFPVYIALIVGGIAALSAAFRQRLQASAWWLAVPLAGFASMVAVRASEFLTLLNVGACLMLLVLIARVAFRRQLTDLRIAEYLRLPFLPFRFLRPALETAGNLITSPKAYRDKPLVRQSLKGAALAIPVLGVFLLLFASADLVFQKYVTDLFSFHVDDELVARTIMIGIVTAGFTGAFAYLFGRTEPEAAPAEMVRGGVLGKVEGAILLGSVNALFLAFILVQLAYLFGGQANITAQGFTYAEYARKGFFELLAVGVVSFLLLWFSEKFAETKQKGHTLLFKLLATGLIAQVLVVIASAFRRLQLYEEAYGFTALRLYSHAFTIFLAAIFLILAYKIIRSASDRVFAFPAFLAAIAFLAALNMLNPDAFIARQNLDRFDKTGKIDTYYLSRLSADAVPVLHARSGSLPHDDRKLLDAALQDRLETSGEYQADWRSWNLSRQRAEQLSADD